MNECFLKLMRFGDGFKTEEHFFHTAARAMRQVLIDHARRRRMEKTYTRMNLVSAIREEANGMTVAVNFDDRLRFVWRDLQKIDPQLAETLRMQVVESLTLDEIAEVQDRAVWRVRADIVYAKRWLRENYTSIRGPRA